MIDPYNFCAELWLVRSGNHLSTIILINYYVDADSTGYGQEDLCNN